MGVCVVCSVRCMGLYRCACVLCVGECICVVCVIGQGFTATFATEGWVSEYKYRVGPLGGQK